jgi:hypothetical protein
LPNDDEYTLTFSSYVAGESAKNPIYIGDNDSDYAALEIVESKTEFNDPNQALDTNKFSLESNVQYHLDLSERLIFSMANSASPELPTFPTVAPEISDHPPTKLKSRKLQNPSRMSAARLLRPRSVLGSGLALDGVPRKRTSLRQTLPLSNSSETYRCVVCREDIASSLFWNQESTKRCKHPERVCIACMQNWIPITMQNKGPTNISCPFCGVCLDYADVCLVATKEVFKR